MYKEFGDSQASLSRRDFFGFASVGVAGVALTFVAPAIAFAEAGQSDSRHLPEVDSTRFAIVSERRIDQMWEEALTKARAEGAEIALNDPHPLVASFASVSATVQASVTIGGVPDVIYLLASYENSSDSTRITKVNNKYAYGFYSACENGSYSHVLADGGRTLVINATVTLRNGVGFAQSFKLHGEFGPTGGNYLTAAYI